MSDLRAEMSSYLNKLNGDSKPAAESSEQNTESSNEQEQKDENADEEQHEEPEKEQDEPSPKVKKDEESEDESDEDKEEKEEKEDKEDKDQKSKKPNRYQRLKAQRDEAVAAVEKVKSEYHKALKVAHAWRAEALLFEEELKKIKEKAKATGFERSPEEEALFEYERERTGRQVDEELEQKLQLERQKEQARAIVNQMKERFAEEASNLADKYGLDDPREILIRLHTERSLGRKVSMEDVAKKLAVGVRRKSEERQIEVNEDAPRPIKKGRGVPVDYPATPDGMLKFLKASGLAS